METLNLLEDRIGNNLEKRVIGKDILNRTPMRQEIIPRTIKWHHTKFKSFTQERKHLTEKRQPTEQEKNFVSYFSNREIDYINN